MSKGIRYTILVISIAVPLIVAFLLFLPEKVNIEGEWINILPHVNGSLNTVTSLLLITGFIMVKNKKLVLHKAMMSSAFFIGILFLISYLVYHSTSESTVFGDLNGNGVLEEAELSRAGTVRGVYLVILLSHILLAIMVVPFVLFTFYYALTEKYDKHRKIVRYTLPIWLYVSVTGVAVYLMIRPYY